MKREDLEAREFGLIIASSNFPFYAAPEADAVMDTMEARIKELEEKYKRLLGENQGNFDAMSIAIDGWEKRECELLERIAELESQLPKWHRVEDGDLPKNLNIDGEQEVIALIESIEGGIVNRWTQALLYKENHEWYEYDVWFYNLDTPLRPELKVVMWCVLPPPPTTEEK